MTMYAKVSPEGDVLDYTQVAPLGDGPLAAGKPRYLPLEIVETPFDPATQVRLEMTETVEASRVVRTWPVRAKTSDEVAQMRAAKLAQIKAEAERRIVAIMPEHRQRNALAQGLALVLTNGAEVSAWPAEDQATYGAVMDAWAAIQAIRTRSDELEATVPQLPAAIAAFDPEAGWE